jgi:hypothetical protein
VAGLNGTTADNVQVSVTNELPTAGGRFSYSQSSLLEDLWVNPQEPFNTGSLHLGTGHMLSVRPRTASGQEGLTGSTSATTTALTAADRSVATSATVSLRDLRLLPTTFIGTAPGAVVWIDEFTATTTCKATGAATAPDPTATWTGRMYFWKDSDPSDNLPGGSYVQLNLAGNLASDPLAGLAGINNPLVYDGPDASSDVYLFKTDTQNGFLTSASSLYNVSTSGVSKDAEGRSRTATIGGAIRIDTTPLSADSVANPDSGLRLSIGSLSCEAVDKR